jgi:sigma-E factor negative regulatory protein RseA
MNNLDQGDDAAAQERSREHLSALADAELDAADVAQVCADWQQSAQAQATWHAYHVMGDALRSGELVTHPAHDAAFLQTFKARLQQEAASGAHLTPITEAPAPHAALPVDSGMNSGVDSGIDSGAPSETEAEPTVVRLFPTRRRSKRHLDARLRGVQVVTPPAPQKNHWRWLVPTAAAASFVGLVGSTLLNRSVEAPQLVTNAPTTIAPTYSQPAPVASPSEPAAVVANRQLIRDAQLDHYLEAHQQFVGSSALGVPSGYLRSATTVQAQQR